VATIRLSSLQTAIVLPPICTLPIATDQSLPSSSTLKPPKAFQQAHVAGEGSVARALNVVYNLPIIHCSDVNAKWRATHNSNGGRSCSGSIVLLGWLCVLFKLGVDRDGEGEREGHVDWPADCSIGPSASVARQ